MESTQSFRVGWRRKFSTPTFLLTRVESTQSYRVGWSAVMREPTSWLTLFAVRNSCRVQHKGFDGVPLK